MLTNFYAFLKLYIWGGSESLVFIFILSALCFGSGDQEGQILRKECAGFDTFSSCFNIILSSLSLSDIVSLPCQRRYK